MTRSAVIARETAVSACINVALSILFFMAVFGLQQPVSLAALGPDFLPQSFMIALMGSLVPALLLSRKMGGAARPIILRAIAIALVAAAIGGGGAFLLCRASAQTMLDPVAALAIKAVYGGALSALTTPVAVAAYLRSVSQKGAMQ